MFSSDSEVPFELKITIMDFNETASYLTRHPSFLPFTMENAICQGSRFIKSIKDPSPHAKTLTIAQVRRQGA